MSDNKDLKCECGHTLEAHDLSEYFGGWICFSTPDEVCNCTDFEADKYQSFGEHPAAPIEVKKIEVVAV